MIRNNVIEDLNSGSNVTTTDGSTGAKNDTYELSRHAVGVMVTSAGDIKIKTLKGNARTINLAANVFYPLGVKQVYSTGTAQTNAQIVLLYSER